MSEGFWKNQIAPPEVVFLESEAGEVTDLRPPGPGRVILLALSLIVGGGTVHPL